jgi:hypothetical protein
MNFILFVYAQVIRFIFHDSPKDPKIRRTPMETPMEDAYGKGSRFSQRDAYGKDYRLKQVMIGPLKF